MYIERMAELSTMIVNLRKAAEELERTWCIHADGCEHIMAGTTAELDRGCTHSDSKGIPSRNPACKYDQCPLLE